MNPFKRHALSLGMLLGLGLSMISLLQMPQSALPDGLAAQAGSHAITQAELDRAIAGAEKDQRRSLTQAEKTQILDTLIDEHLLLIYAEQNQLQQTVPALRRMTVDHVLEGLRQQALALQPSEQDLKAFAVDNARYFSVSVQANGELANWSALEPLALREWQRRQAEVLLDELLSTMRTSVAITQIKP